MEDCKLESFHLGVKALIFNTEGKILLLERDHPIKKRYWDIPGGRLQRGESMMETLRREVKEEIGLEGIHEVYPLTMVLTDIRIPFCNDTVGLIFSIYCWSLSAPFQPVLSSEHIHFDWFTPLEASQKLKIQYPTEFVEKLANLTR